MYALFQEDKPAPSYTPADMEADYVGMTSYYWTLVLGQVGAALATTTTRQSVFQFGMPNVGLNLCIALEILFAFLVITWTPLQGLFKTRHLPVHLLLAGAFGFILIFGVEELRKLALRRLWPGLRIRG
uniref:Cation-transporting P-type ATPase C-terminal domain-containing protein n=1 Tax=Alexandrium andersonii TaxID=327968 RepID=A0A7S2CH05_9DINO|mmetsp:Transcript_38824/g.88278  ORF Transcript_38824/g.88278 Transcript_38824/m.88278 type:complete len:128 (+) Transcript_38824:1-384(+)